MCMRIETSPSLATSTPSPPLSSVIPAPDPVCLGSMTDRARLNEVEPHTLTGTLSSDSCMSQSVGDTYK